MVARSREEASAQILQPVDRFVFEGESRFFSRSPVIQRCATNTAKNRGIFVI